MAEGGQPVTTSQTSPSSPTPEIEFRFFSVLEERFNLLNQYCDTTHEPKTFNSLEKFGWGKREPLSYIGCYYTHGNVDHGIVDHWHFISFGLSDLYGTDLSPIDPRQRVLPNKKSGLGFELTIRVKCEGEGKDSPPLWPLDLLQQFSRYILYTNSEMLHGDHATWKTGLDGNPSVISNMMFVNDYSIPTLATSTGIVNYLQIVGAHAEELDAAQHWSGIGVLDIFRKYPESGGPALLTDMTRTKSIFELYPAMRGHVFKAIDRDGSNLTGVGVKLKWTNEAWKLYDDNNVQFLNASDRVKYDEMKGRAPKTTDNHVINEVAEALSYANIRNETSSTNHNDLQEPTSVGGIYPTVKFNSIHMTMDHDAGLLMPLALRGRVSHNRHFTYKHPVMEDAVTFVFPGMNGAFTKEGSPFCAEGPWLHICLDEETRMDMIHSFLDFVNSGPALYPHTFLWPKGQFALTLTKD